MKLIGGYSLESNPRATISWIDPHGSIIVTGKENYLQDDGPGVVQLGIMRANRGDRGQWTCKMEISVCIYSCLDDEKLLKSGQDGQEPDTECLKKFLTNISTINLDVFCKCNI